MINHTPGPWRTDGRARYSYVSDDGRVRSIGAYAVFADDGLACVAVVIPGCLPARGRDDAARANARLIAAAPDLLDTLRDLATAADERFAVDDPYRAIVAQACAIVSDVDGD